MTRVLLTDEQWRAFFTALLGVASECRTGGYWLGIEIANLIEHAVRVHTTPSLRVHLDQMTARPSLLQDDDAQQFIQQVSSRVRSLHNAYGVFYSSDPVQGTLVILLPLLEPGHRVRYLSGIIGVYYGRDGSYRVALFPPLVSDPVFYPASTPSEVFSLVGHSYSSDLLWELQ